MARVPYHGCRAHMTAHFRHNPPQAPQLVIANTQSNSVAMATIVPALNNLALDNSGTSTALVSNDEAAKHESVVDKRANTCTTMVLYTEDAKIEDATIIRFPPDEAPIQKIPYDVAYMIFKLVGLGNATALGLTCKGMYRFLKEMHPTPILLNITACSILEYYNLKDHWKDKHEFLPSSWEAKHKCPTLATRLQDSMPAGYRFCEATYGDSTQYWQEPPRSISIYRFVNSSVYGKVTLRPSPHAISRDTSLMWGQMHGLAPMSSGFSVDGNSALLVSPAQNRLHGRYADWLRAIPTWDAYKKGKVGTKPLDTSSSILPSPFNLGHTWYELAMKAIMNELYSTEDFHKRNVFWRGSFLALNPDFNVEFEEKTCGVIERRLKEDRMGPRS